MRKLEARRKELRVRSDVCLFDMKLRDAIDLRINMKSRANSTKS